MKIFFRCMVAMLGVVVFGACTTPSPTYVNPLPSPDDAVLAFESDFELHTHFLISTQPGADCKEFKTAGYLLKKDSIFIYDKPNHEIRITIPHGKLIGVAGYHYFHDSTYRSSCYPPGRYFFPSPNEEYVVKMNYVELRRNRRGNTEGKCDISIRNAKTGDEVKTIALIPSQTVVEARTCN